MSPDNVCHVLHAAVADFCVATVEDRLSFCSFGKCLSIS